MTSALRHVGVSLGAVSHWHDGLGEFSRRIAEGLAERADELRERDGLQLHLHLPRRWHGLFGERLAYLDAQPQQRWWHRPPQRFVLWHRLHQHIRLRPAAGAALRVETVHDLNFLHDKRGLSLARYRWRLRRRLQGATAVAITRYVAAELARETGAQAEVIVNGVTDFSHLPARPVPQAQGAPYLLHLSRMAPSKNTEALLQLALHWPAQRLLLAGPRSRYTDALAERIGALELHNVQLLLDLDDAQKAWLYAHCAGFVFPSLAEGFGLPPIEAMHFGRPVFLSRCTCLPEVGGDAAYYFDSFEPQAMRLAVLSGLARHDAARADAVRRWAARYRWAACVDGYVALYRRLLAGAAAAR
jgi:glycosyltransferase involved in cell wall biosynthesis